MLDKTKLVRKELCHGKKDYKTDGIFYGSFLPPKIKYCLTIDKIGIEQEHKIFKGFKDSKRLPDCSQYFNMIDG